MFYPSWLTFSHAPPFINLRSSLTSSSILLLISSVSNNILYFCIYRRKCRIRVRAPQALCFLAVKNPPALLSISMLNKDRRAMRRSEGCRSWAVSPPERQLPGRTSLEEWFRGEERCRNAADKETKRLKRLQRNRVPAQQARERKKAYLNALETRVEDFEKKSTELGERLSTLQNENQMLRHILKNTTESRRGGNVGVNEGTL